MTNDDFAEQCARLAADVDAGYVLSVYDPHRTMVHRALRCCARMNREGVLNVLRNNCGDDVSLGIVADAVLGYLLREGS